MSIANSFSSTNPCSEIPFTPTVKYRIVPDSIASDGRVSPPEFYTILIDKKGLNLSVPSISISTPEKVERTVTYSTRDRITGTFEQQVMGELIRLGYEARGDSIMIFQLPKNNRRADYVVYNSVYIEVLD